MEKKKGLELLREPFLPNQISKKPQGTKAQNECKYEDKRRCSICGGFHHPGVIHLDYVGHAALTDRLLDADPLWTWEPFAINEEGLPAFDKSGGLWIRLTVCGHTRIGYGHATSSQYKEIGSREKEVIGDALRNAAMRFGAALDLWHKGELHTDDTENNGEQDKKPPEKRQDAPEAPQEDVPEFTPEQATKAVEEAQGQIVTSLKKRLGEKMKGMKPMEMKAFYGWMLGDKKETVDVLQGFLDNYDSLATEYEFSQRGMDDEKIENTK